MNNLLKRTITGAFFVIVMIGSALLGQTMFVALMAVITTAGLYEFFHLVDGHTNQPAAPAASFAGVIVFAAIALYLMQIVGAEIMLLIPLLLFVLFFYELWRNKPNPFSNIALCITGIIYVAVPFAMLTGFFESPGEMGFRNAGILMGYFAILWLNDTGAYLVGSYAGKHRLFERISPKKSWEGTIGGAVIALLTAWGYAFLYTGLNLFQWMVIACIIIVTGTLGDLVESMLKRSRGVKDSGKILPGHGGILDRFDAVLLSVPFVFVYLALFCR